MRILRRERAEVPNKEKVYSVVGECAYCGKPVLFFITESLNAHPHSTCWCFGVWHALEVKYEDGKLQLCKEGV